MIVVLALGKCYQIRLAGITFKYREAFLGTCDILKLTIYQNVKAVL